MISSLIRSLPCLRPKWTPLNFTNPNFVRLPTSHPVEEENFPGYVASRYYPTLIGEILQDRYQVVGKLGFGASSTVWLARDMEYQRYVALKIFINATSMGQEIDDELNIYERIQKASQKHRGRKYVRSLLDSFDIDGPEDKHRCLVHPPLWKSVATFLRSNPVPSEQRLPPVMLAVTLHRLFLALDYLHTECKVIHTDIKADNLLFGIDDESVFFDFEQNELDSPCPRREIDGRTIYTTRELRIPKNLGAPILCDFGSAVRGDEQHTEDIQPDIYRAPEVILQVPWTYSVDIWNVGCVIFNLFLGGSLFSGQDPEFQAYRSRAHLAEMVSVFGPPPPDLRARGQLTGKFFSEKGELSAGIRAEEHVPLETLITGPEGENKERFFRLVQKMLQWEPEKRQSAKELAMDEWIQMELHK
ncbi:hypothetical protein N7456_002247 [Penicillium angulare]|uniref:Protein kinase domain-containing protein n=1 Tax=Penicillium angulare TaxID=116970 RepID=A0A9W9KQ47_9EURO|nr:hypothetical protein N7456_002247 [Penicillium angulare]